MIRVKVLSVERKRFTYFLFLLQIPSSAWVLVKIHCYLTVSMFSLFSLMANHHLFSPRILLSWSTENKKASSANSLRFEGIPFVNNGPRLNFGEVLLYHWLFNTIICFWYYKTSYKAFHELPDIPVCSTLTMPSSYHTLSKTFLSICQRKHV